MFFRCFSCSLLQQPWLANNNLQYWCRKKRHEIVIHAHLARISFYPQLFERALRIFFYKSSAHKILDYVLVKSGRFNHLQDFNNMHVKLVSGGLLQIIFLIPYVTVNNGKKTIAENLLTEVAVTTKAIITKIH